MLKKMPTHCGDETCASCVVAGDYIFLAHHAGHNGGNANDIVDQVRNTFENIKRTLSTVNATLDDIVEIKFYLKSKKTAHNRTVCASPPYGGSHTAGTLGEILP